MYKHFGLMNGSSSQMPLHPAFAGRRKDLAFTRSSAIIQFMNWREHILSDPQILRGKPCIKAKPALHRFGSSAINHSCNTEFALFNPKKDGR